MEASLANGIYDDGDCICADCLSSQFYSFQLNSSNKVLQSNHKQQKKQSQLIVKDKLYTQKQLEKAGRLVRNIKNMIKSGGALRINSRNEEAFHEAVKQVGMRINAFTIERDGCYLEICLKCNNVKDAKSAMLPKLLERPKLPDKNQN
jgi:hypothetical protein